VAVFVGFLGGMFPAWIAAVLLARPFATAVPAPDVRGLIPMILRENAGTFRTSNPRGWAPKDVWDVLIAIIAEQMGVAPETLEESTSFVNDLGMD
jgi:hypothetical protein